MELLLAALLGFALAVVVFLVFRRVRSRSASAVQVHSFITEMKAVGELVVFKILTKEIVTQTDHKFGELGKKWLDWLVSSKKMALIFDYGIDFKYNLRSPDFGVKALGDGRYELRLPACYHDVNVRGIQIYDEQGSRLIPWLMPKVLDLLGSGFGPEEKNRLITEAGKQADVVARKMVEQIQGEVQASARQTITALARGFGAREVVVTFTEGAAPLPAPGGAATLPAGDPPV